MRLLKGWLNPKLNSEIAPTCQNSSWKPVVDLLQGPCQRSQHAICATEDFLYLYGGRGPYGCLNDLWKYNIEKQSWSLVELHNNVDSKPPPLEGHSLLVYSNDLYLFGGETSFASADEVPLWKFCTKPSEWKKLAHTNSDSMPVGRREHVAVIFNGSLLIHGGYIDLKGPSDELWSYNVSKNTWKLFDSLNNVYPAARYKHAGVIYQDALWICGGLMGITDRNETQIWTWNLLSFFWTPIKIRGAPTQLFNHAACLAGDEVLIFGGNQENGQTSSKLWRAKMTDLKNKHSQTWRLCHFQDKVSPSPSCNHCMIALPSSMWLPSPEPLHSDIILDSCLKEIDDTDSSGDATRTDISLNEEVLDQKAKPKLVNVRSLSDDRNFSEGHNEKNVVSLSQDEDSPSSIFDVDCDTDIVVSTVDDNDGSGDAVWSNSKENLLQSFKLGESGDLPKRFQYKYDGYINKCYVDSPRVHEDQAVKRYSYNLSVSNLPWQPNRKPPKYQTTSFIDISHSHNLQKSIKSISNDAVTFAKSPNREQVVLPTTFHENANKLREIETNLHRTAGSKTKSRSERGPFILLLFGGSVRAGNFHLKEPIHIWKCNLSSTIS